MRSQRFTVLAALLLLVVVSTRANAAVTLGFIEKWPTSTSGWLGGALTYSNPLNGGADDDGFLQMSLASPGHFGTKSQGEEYTGDWIAAGVNQIKLKLNDLASNSNLSMHVSVGTAVNLWQYNIGFVPATETWTEFVVDLTDSTLFTRIVGSGTFSSALHNVNLIHIRNDLPPFSQTPDNASGDLGIDDLLLTSNGTSGVGDPPRSGVIPIDLAAPSPNPSRGPVALTMRASEDSPIQVRILDVLGREIRHQTLAGSAGLRVWVWDGRDAQGNMAPAGVYRVIAASKAGGTSRSLVRIR